MATTTGRIASGSTNGRGIVIQSIVGASGTVLHTVTATGTALTTFDEVYVYGVNLTSAVKKLRINAGGGASGDAIRLTLPSSSGGPTLIMPGLRYNNAVVIRASATVAGVVACHVYVNRTA